MRFATPRRVPSIRAQAVPACSRRGAAPILISGCAAALLALLAHAVAAATLTGRVVEAGRRTAIEGAEVVLRGAADSSLVAHGLSDSTGTFRISGLAAGHFVFRVAAIGYLPRAHTPLELAEGRDLDLGVLALTVAAVKVPGAEVSTARSTAVLAADRNIYLARDIPAAGAGTTTDLLRAVPELDVDVDGRVSLRGSSGVTVQINGRTSPLKGEALQTFLRQLPGSRVERVEVLANPSARFDPEGVAGIVNIVLKDDVKLGVSGSLNAYLGARHNGIGGRVAWQEGPLTLFGGTTLTGYSWEYGSHTTRRSLLTSPPSVRRTDIAGDSRGVWSGSDLSADLALGKRFTAYATLNANPNWGTPRTRTRTSYADSTGAAASASERVDDGDNAARSWSVTAGLQHVRQKGRDERSLELLDSGNGAGQSGDARQVTSLPSGTPDLLTARRSAPGNRERAVQFDDTHPLGAKGKLETGVRFAERVGTLSSAVRFANGDGSPPPAADEASDHRHHESFRSLYVTAGSTFGRLSGQLGLRGELANTSFEVFSSALRFERDYRSLFPSANAAWDFGAGRTLRLAYSKRIERPGAQYLNPVVPAADTLERFAGNPDLGPRHTHSVSFDAAWQGSRGMLKLSPWWRKTVDNWDVVTTVNTNGAALSTWRNASSVRTLGVNATGSLRKTGRFGGTLTLGVASEHHDASNLSSAFRTDVVAWSASGNATFKATKRLDLQGFLRYAPPRTLAQGRASSYVFTSLGLRWELAKAAWLGLNVNDPFRLSKSWSETGDETYDQRTDSDNRMRGLSGSFTWTWGRIPEQKQRRQSGAGDASEATQPPGR